MLPYYGNTLTTQHSEKTDMDINTNSGTRANSLNGCAQLSSLERLHPIPTNRKYFRTCSNGLTQALKLLQLCMTN